MSSEQRAVDREKVLKGLEICNDMDGRTTCERCPYCGYDNCGYLVDRDARDTILADAAEIAELEDVVFNLRLYLTYLLKNAPLAMAILEHNFDGLPGFVEVDQ